MKVLILSNNIDAFYIQEGMVTIYIMPIENQVPKLLEFDHVMIDLHNSSKNIEQVSTWKKLFKQELAEYSNESKTISLFCAPIDIKHYEICPSALFENIFPVEFHGTGYIVDDKTHLEVKYDVAFDHLVAKDLMKVSADKTLFFETNYGNAVLRFYGFSLNTSSQKALKQMVAYFLLYDGKKKLVVATKEQLVDLYQQKAEIVDGVIVPVQTINTQMAAPVVGTIAETPQTVQPVNHAEVSSDATNIDSSLIAEAKIEEDTDGSDLTLSEKEPETIFSRSSRTQQANMNSELMEQQSLENTTSIQRLVVSKEKEEFEKTRELQGLIAEVNERTAVIEKVEAPQNELVDEEEKSSNTILVILILIILVSIVASAAFVYLAFFS